jgi:hypothetical protein
MRAVEVDMTRALYLDREMQIIATSYCSNTAAAIHLQSTRRAGVQLSRKNGCQMAVC